MSLATQLYKYSPLFVQNSAVTAFGFYWKWFRFGGDFRARLVGYRNRERFDQEQWVVWQSARLRSVLRRASEHVPYYVAHWTPRQKLAASSGVLEEIPLLSKNPIREFPRRFLDEKVSRKNLSVFHTSGSTGTPIATFWTKGEYRDALAVRESRSAGWANVSFCLPRATFSGRMIVPDPRSKGPFHRFNFAERQVYLSPFHLRQETVGRYVEAIQRHNVVWMTGYAVSFFLMAKMMVAAGLRLSGLRAVITTSEKLTVSMRETMRAAYGCPIFEEYSTVENSLFVSECEAGALHSSPDVAVVEILRPDGTPCEPNESGEIVATCLMRPSQPFIRYRLGDVGAWASVPCPCGRQMPILKEVVGRLEDVIIGPDGRELVRFHGVFVDQPNVVEGQIVQEADGSIIVKVVGTPNFGSSDILDIKRRVTARLGDEVQVNVMKVDAIERTTAGKFRAVISKYQPRQRSSTAASA